MMKKMWKNRSGVSPVIATILMVAITVVLAAVLYVMVMGFGSPSTQTPTGSLTSVKTSSGYTVQVVSISKNDVVATDVKIVISPSTPGTVGDYISVLTGVKATNASHVTAGDYVTLTNLGAGQTYTVTMIYTPSGNAVASTTIVVPAT